MPQDLRSKKGEKKKNGEGRGKFLMGGNKKLLLYH